MTTEAHFVRTDTAEGARFEVTPAPAPGAQGCFFVGGYLIAGLIALGGLSLGIAGFLFSAVLWGPLLLVLWLVGKSSAEKYSRAPVTLIVNAHGITAGDRVFPAESIAELLLRHPSDDGGARYELESRSAGQAIGQSIAQEVRNRSFALMARLKSGSVPEVLVFGLTYNTGVALLNDVIATMKGA